MDAQRLAIATTAVLEQQRTDEDQFTEQIEGKRKGLEINDPQLPQKRKQPSNL